jgi:hypothetical protein
LSRFWLYFGVFLACTGIGTVPGILLIIFYIWSEIKKSSIIQNSLQNSEYENSIDPQYFDDETAEKMR